MIETIDIAHPPLPGYEAEKLLDEKLREIHLSSRLRILKIVHGFGSGGKGGALKAMVSNWCYTRRSRIRAVISGEDLSPFNPSAQELALTCNLIISNTFGAPNAGVTVVWIK